MNGQVIDLPSEGSIVEFIDPVTKRGYKLTDAGDGKYNILEGDGPKLRRLDNMSEDQTVQYLRKRTSTSLQRDSQKKYDECLGG